MPLLGDPYISTPLDLIRAKLELGEISSDDMVFDLGCGDGRVLVLAALEYGAHGVGVELQQGVVEEAWSVIADHDLEDVIEIRQEDYQDTDLKTADLIILYLTTRTLHSLSDKLRAVKPGCRIVTHDFNLSGWAISEQHHWTSASGEITPLYLYKK